MSEWPDGWFRDGKPEAASGAADDGSDQTVTVSRPQHPGGQYQVRQYPGSPPPAGSGPAGSKATPPPGGWPSQPPLKSDDNVWARGIGPRGTGQVGGSAGTGARDGAGSGGGLAAPPAPAPARPGGPRPPRSGGAGRRWLRPGRIFGVLAVVVAVLLAGTLGAYFYFNSKLTRSNILVDYAGRPAAGAGTNWLIAGSDSRQGLTKKQERAYSTGYVSGSGRSDTVMILHIPSNGGRPVLISIPRDSYVNIPGHGMDKINAAYSIGGPALLAQTIQSDTGLYINHFMDIGFGGFVQVVNAVGGVRMCLSTSLKDAASGVHLKKGCQVLSGGEALAYVRDRHEFASQDLQREQDQRIFLKALLTKMTSPSVMFNPFAALPAASGVVGTLTVDQGTNLYQLVQVAMAMKDPLTTTVPIATANDPTWAGDAVLWNSSQANELWDALKTDQTVPSDLITGSHQA
jgi:LCP family protein required for cell wall assembly